MKTFKIAILAICVSLMQSCNDLPADKEDGKLKSDKNNERNVSDSRPRNFEKISSGHSSVHFSNQIQPNLETLDNLFDFDYFYNGAGVGLEDLNNDGLIDIFFCGNQVQNRLYINKGDFKFTDVTETAGINQGKNWSNGVTFVDINNDGFYDIYVSQGGPNQRLYRKNLLYINNGDGTFQEKAEEYGLADMGISTQSVFFDYDKDGDLDCLVMNENELYGLDPINLQRLSGKDSESKYFNSSHLYQNNNGKFVDVTPQAGLTNPLFGLGLCVSDINNDNWLDIYIASDYYIPDALYINQKNGTFKDEIKEATGQISYYGMGIDIADINNDTLQDIFVLDMASSDHVRSKTLMASMNTSRFDYLTKKAGYHYQYMYNSLQLNRGDFKFDNIAQLTHTANTDWSWSVLMTDFDMDEDKDIHITNGYRRYALDNDIQNKVYDAQNRYQGKVPLQVKEDLYYAMPSEKLRNILYENNGNLDFEESSKEWGFGEFTFSNGAATGDLDNDGDLDLVINNMDDEASVFKNLSIENNGRHYIKIKPVGRSSETFPKVSIHYNGKTQFAENKRVRGYMSAQENIVYFGLGKNKKIDTLNILWPSGKSQQLTNIKSDTTLLINESNALLRNATASREKLFKPIDAKRIGLDFKHQENDFDDFEKEILLPYKQSTQGPFITKGDINNDGLVDIYIGGASGQAGKLFIQEGNAFKQLNIPHFNLDRGFEDMQAVFFNLNNDEFPDLYVVSGGNEFLDMERYADRVYINEGGRSFSRAADALQFSPSNGKAVAAIDYDGDGDDDLILGNRIAPQNYPVPMASQILENDNGVLKESTAQIASELADFGIVNDILVTDYDKDGNLDFLTVGEWSDIGFFKNQGGKFKREYPLGDSSSNKGWWFSITETDINKDGLPDYVLGNVGENIKFSASPEKPFKIYSNDFDDNGVPDIVLSKKYKGTYVPVRGRECSSQQMPFIQQKFPTYSEFANASLVDVYGEKLEQGYQTEATEFRSIILINKGNGQFDKKKLPKEAQISPALSAISMDLNKDGFQDVILAGNIYETEVETPRLDAGNATILLSDGKENYIPLHPSKIGLYLNGNIKDIKVIEFRNQKILLTAANDSYLSTYTLNNN